MKISARIYRILSKLLIAVVVLVVAGVLLFLAMQISGRNRLYGNGGQEAPDLNMTDSSGAVQASAAGLAAGWAGMDSGEWQDGDVRYEGDIYRYNGDILTFLFLGIDHMEEATTVPDGIDGGQSDAIFLLALNPHSQRATVIGIPRDTMAQITVYDEQGNYLGVQTAQLALQHGYGDGGKLSCERSQDAVSQLFYGLPIHGYCAVNMGAIPLLNDVVGGVDVTAVEDVPGTGIRKGQTVHLEGQSAYDYLHNRDTGSFASAAGRLERQKQYLAAYAAKAMEGMREDITLPVKLYSTLSRYMVTDITVDEVSYLAPQLLDYEFDRSSFRTLAGETVMGEEFEEFYIDDQALYRLVLEVFYEKVGE